MATPPPTRKEMEEEVRKIKEDGKRLSRLASQVVSHAQDQSIQSIPSTQEDYGEYGEDESEEGNRRTTGESGEGRGSTGLTLPEPVIEEDVIGPGYNHKFRPAVVQFWVEKIIKSWLKDKSYAAEEVQLWTCEIAKEILDSTHLLRFPRYKLVVNVVIAERSNDALASAYRCLWDAEADCSTSYTFTNDTLYCVAIVHGIYCY